MTVAEYSIVPHSMRDSDRRPPYSEDAEQAVLAACLIDERAMLASLEVVDDTMFYAERHRRIYRAMASLAESATTIDPLTLANRLKDRGDLEGAGGKDYLGFLVDAVPHAANVGHHAKIVREKAMLRRLIEVSSVIVGEAFSGGRPASELARDAFASLLPMTVDDRGDRGFRRVKDDVWDVLTEIEAMAAGKVFGIRTGYALIDSMTGGFADGELVIVGAAEGMGKSAFSLNLALRVASRPVDDGGGAVGYVSAEMSRKALVKRCLSWTGRIDGRSLRTGALRDDDFTKLSHGAGVLVSLPLWIDEQAEPSLGDVIAKCTALKAAHPEIRMLVVDFLQLVRMRGSAQNRNEQLTEIAYALKGMAKRLGVVVIAPCQVNTKDVETQKDQRPEPKDLQGSSGMRQAADFVALLFRAAVYDPMADRREIEVAFKKCRDGEPFLARLRWDGPTLTISDPV